jgi:hypothetical protein
MFKTRLLKYGFALVIVFIIAMVFFLSDSREKNLRVKIEEYCKSNERICLSEVTDFEWDAAYIDRTPYNKGTKIKDIYKFEGEFEALQTDFSTRIAFCNDGKLVYDLVLNNFYFEFEQDIEIIYPSCVFNVVWETVTWEAAPDLVEEKLLLYIIRGIN